MGDRGASADARDRLALEARELGGLVALVLAAFARRLEQVEHSELRGSLLRSLPSAALSALVDDHVAGAHPRGQRVEGNLCALQRELLGDQCVEA